MFKNKLNLFIQLIFVKFNQSGFLTIFFHSRNSQNL